MSLNCHVYLCSFFLNIHFRLIFSLSVTDSSMIIRIFRPITQRCLHLAKHRVNAVELVHQHRMQPPHLLAIHV